MNCVKFVCLFCALGVWERVQRRVDISDKRVKPIGAAFTHKLFSQSCSVLQLVTPRRAFCCLELLSACVSALPNADFKLLKVRIVDFPYR